MTLPEICIRRPVFTTMLILFPVVVGLISYGRMGTDLFPNVDLPIVTVSVTRPGTSVEEMETGVTKRIEDVINTIAGIDELRSTTKEGFASITIQFLLEKNRDVAQQEVQGKINTILSQLPAGTEAPIVDKFDIDASPVLTLAISADRNMKELTEIADKQIKDALSALDGVGQVILVGGEKRAIQVRIDTRKLEAYNLSIEQVRQSLASQNLELPGGRVDQGQYELILRTRGRITAAEKFNDIIIENRNGQPIRVRDLGVASDLIEEPRSVGRLDNRSAVLLVVQKQSGANTVAVIDTLKKRLGELQIAFGQTGRGDIKMEVIRDQSRFINQSLHEVKFHLVIGAVLVALTILLFLRDWRTMLIAATSIPVSLISTFMVMSWLGFTLNNITMLALVLAVGIVIDDAVVVHENIFRWMEEKGYKAREASLFATKEIALAVVATTFSLVVIFLPIAFMSGRVGRFFFSFGVTTAVAILMSMLVSFTLTPMLCSRFLKLSHGVSRLRLLIIRKTVREPIPADTAAAEEAVYRLRPKYRIVRMLVADPSKDHHSGGIYGRFVERPYLTTLRWAMRHRWAVVLAAIVTFASVVPLGMFVGKDFLPKDDQSEFEIAITTPAGWSRKQVDDTFKEIEKQVGAWPEVTHVLTTIGDTTGRITKAQGDVTQGSIYIRVHDLVGRPKINGKHWDQWQVMERARGVMARYPDLRSSVQIPQAISSGTVNAEVEFTLVGPDLERLGKYAERLVYKLRQNPGLKDVDTTLALRKPELQVDINRDRASDLGVNVRTIASTLQVLVGGDIVSDYKDPVVGELYDVWLRADSPYRDNRQAIEYLSVPSTKAGLVKLGNLATMKEARGPAQIDRFARQRKITLVSNLATASADRPAYSVDQAIKAFEDAFATVEERPDGTEGPASAEYQLIPSGRAKTQAESNSAFAVALVLSLIFMYMILAAQFESFVHPITILLAVPLTIPFALLSLIVLGQALNIYSILGVFLLFGIVKKNGILQVDYMNVLRARAAEDPNVIPPEFASRAPAEPGARGVQSVELRNAANGNGNGNLSSALVSTRGGWNRWMERQSDAKRVRLWATIEANRTRLRPILMTTLMLIAGMIPIALGEGPGAGSRASMAKVIVGGQALSLLLSLLITPVAYSLFDDITLFRRRRREAREAAATRTFAVDPLPSTH
jgi:HAE1 family hydrophobic/amphiphilic exporter-1